MRLFLWVNAAFIYDMLILGALSVALSALFLVIAGSHYEQDQTLRLFFQIAWVLLISAYYLVSWKKGGQTIGMRAWKLRVVGADSQALTTKAVLTRFICAILNLLLLNIGWLGYLLPSRLSLTDKLSATRIEHTTKNG